MYILYGMEQREDNSVAALGRVCSVLTPLLPPLAYTSVCVWLKLLLTCAARSAANSYQV